MTKSLKAMMVLAVLLVSASFSAPAMDMGHDGDAIHTSTVDGITMTYKLIDMRESMKKMGHSMGAMATHHLMVFAKGPDGPVMGKAGYVITDPDGKTEKAMCMAMGDGFGADIHMIQPGTYTVKTKVATEGGKTLMDEFTYTLKQ